ncbi:hypothetical protein KFK09_013323 [Dendrobium nobile]|uniref:Protein FAR1-RELATED SEQUENCE n=1 Tax=Dendrobium nobile TaxID=94219 RepID=A0A8T3B8M0_DENNO|nr:hypothetical protein KFK09_013323 [Dendrobium nobile]
MLSEGNLQNNQWLNDLYKIKEKWSTAFNKDCFNLGILSTQRSESTNHVCHGYSKPTSTITECFLDLEKIMRIWRRNEQDEEFRCSQTDIVPYMKSSPVLKQAAKFYSRKLYAFFEEEFLHGLGGLCVENTSSDLSRFSVWNIDSSIDSHKWIVKFSSIQGTIECTYAKFEMMGILCAYCMRVMRQLDSINIPIKYLLPRWSVNARKDLYSGGKIPSLCSNACQLISGDSNFIFRNYVCRFAYKISTEAQGNKEAEKCVIEDLSTLAAKVHSIKLGRKNIPISGTGHETIKDPKKCRPKGVSNARLKDHGEKKKPKKVNKLPRFLPQAYTIQIQIQVVNSLSCNQ